MEPDQIIERIGTDNPPTIEELTKAQTELSAARAELAASIRESKETADLSAILASKTDFDAVSDALSSVTTALDAAKAEVDAILADVEEAAPTEVEPVVEEVEPVADEVVPVAASIRSTLARIRTQPRPVDPNETNDDITRVDTSFSLLGRDRDSVTAAEVGQAFADAARKFGGTKTSVLSIKHELHPDRTLNGDASHNERKMLDLFGTNPVVPVTASGGCCSIPEPIYDQPLLGDLSRPIKAAFDALGASRGAVQAYPPVCIPDEGADVWTCVQDEAVDPDDDSTWKSCVEVDCETSEPTLVEPIYKCLTIGTFQQRFAPEQWEAILFQTDKLAARLAEARLFDWLQQATTSNFPGFSTGSTYANFIKSQIRAAAFVRQDQRLGDAQMVSVGPDWIYSAIVEDSVTRRLNDADQIEVVKAHVNSVLSDFGITYVGSADIAGFDVSSYDSGLPDYPDNAPVVLLPAGAAKFLDGGEKNLGIDITDHDLNRQNKVAAFSEFWEGLLVRNCNVVGFDVPIEDCTTVPCLPSA